MKGRRIGMAAWVGASILAGSQAFALEPPAVALRALGDASSKPPVVSFRDGTLRVGSFDVPVSGANSFERAQSLLARYPGLLGLGPEATLEVRRVDPDSTPGAAPEVVTFLQKYKGFPVWGAQVSVGLQQAAAGVGIWRARFASGALAGFDSVDLVPAIAEATAVNVARAHLGRSDAPVLGDVVLQVFAPRALGLPPDPCVDACLVYALTLGGGVPTELLVDANAAGQVLFAHPLAESSAGLDDYSADFEDGNGANMIDTWDWGCFNPTTVDDDIGSQDGLIPSYHGDADAVNTWWHVRNTYLWYHDTLGRHSWDDDDGEIVAYVHTGPNPGNGQTGYSHGCGMQFETGGPSFDVTVHEFTHGVINYSPSNLIYSNQSGALNESYADTMGELADPDLDYLHAEDRLDGQGPNRSLSNPPAFGDPDRMSLYVNTMSDSGGVHTNSGIMNKAHYLLAAGGTFNGRTVVSVGRPAVAALAYHLLRFLPPTALFVDARNAAVAQAQAWNWSPAQVCSVRNAYRAVEVGDGDINCDGTEDAGDDTDHDSFADSIDNCPLVPNPSQLDSNADGQGDACEDFDGDGVADPVDNCPYVYNSSGCYSCPQPDVDGDGIGDACDSFTDSDADGFEDDEDNCPSDYNPSQFDGDGNGQGDACDPDADGDGVYPSEGDNCTFVSNANQQDTDGDLFGDACDLCPNTPDQTYAYTIPVFGEDPKPYQPDSDGDGIPDACDPEAFGTGGLVVDGNPYNPATAPKPDGKRHIMRATGPAGSAFRIPLPVCDPADPYALDEKVQLAFQGLDRALRARVLDEHGAEIGRTRPGADGVSQGLRFHPDCARRYFLRFDLLPGWSGSDDFVLTGSAALATGPNPWAAPGGGERPPIPLPDVDKDGLADLIDNCPSAANPVQENRDGDTRGDACDNCPYFATPNFADTDEDRRGDACECTDQNADGRNTVSDLVAVNLAIFDPARVTQLCDGNHDERCDVSDILAANLEIFSPGNTSTCARQPVPGP